MMAVVTIAEALLVARDLTQLGIQVIEAVQAAQAAGSEKVDLNALRKDDDAGRALLVDSIHRAKAQPEGPTA